MHACTAATSCNRKLHKDCCFKNGHGRASFLPDPRNAGISLSCYSADRTTMDPVSTIMANISTNRSAFSCGKHVCATQTGGNNKLNCFSLWNCRGLKSLTVPSKVPFIQDLLREENQLFIALTETWLNEHKNAELLINGYTLFRQDRRRERCRRGRNSGVAVYMKNDIAADMETVINFSNGVEVFGLY